MTAEINFRYAAEGNEKANTAAVRKLWDYSFKSTDIYDNWYFDNIYQPERTICAMSGEEAIAALQLLPYRLRLRGKEHDMRYIVGVVTSPDYRGLGVGRGIMEHTFAELRKSGVNLAVLLPACPLFYTKLGFNYGYEENVWDMPLDRLSVFAEKGGRWREAKIPADIPILDKIYDSMIKKTNGAILRTTANWQKFLAEYACDGGLVRIYNDGEKDCGYLLYQLKRDAAVPTFSVRELGYANAKTKDAAFTFAAAHTNECCRFHWQSAAADKSYLRSPFQDGISRRPAVMGRIVDLEKAIAGTPVNKSLQTEIALKISDRCCPWNDDVYLFHAQNGVLSINKSAQPPEAEMSIKDFTALYWGLASVSQLDIAVSSSAADKLNAIFPACQNWLNEK